MTAQGGCLACCSGITRSIVQSAAHIEPKLFIVQVLVVVVIVNAISHGEQPLQFQHEESCTLNAMPCLLHSTNLVVPSSD
jgi:hypothetical protein